MKFVDLDAQFDPIQDEMRAAIESVLDHKQFIMGPEIGVLENDLSKYCGASHVLSAASGTDALLMALMAYEVGPGDGIIAPSFTFVATAEVVQLLGATTVFTEVGESTFNIDPEQLERTIEAVKSEGNLNLRGIIPVDLFGLPADQDAILFVISDAAQSFGAEYKGRKVGVFGDISTTSFFPAKPLGCYGDGGAVFTDNQDIADKIDSIRFHGKGVSQYENVRIGITGRLDTLQAAILSCKLKIFDQEQGLRQVIADNYSRELSAHVSVPEIPPGYRSSWAVYTIRTPNRNRVRQSLEDNGIPSAVYYPSPLHRQPAFQQAWGAGKTLPVTEKLSQEVISLPVHPYLEELDQLKIVDTIKSATS
jgi:dTDP-4-amino-4,6-dideoxygalactose transaminase